MTLGFVAPQFQIRTLPAALAIRAPESSCCHMVLRGRPPVPTLGALRRSSPWLWMNCAADCGHHRPVAFAPFIIRYGADASSDVLRRAGRCFTCGRKSAMLQHPSWVNTQIGWMPFPADSDRPQAKL